MIRSYLLLTLTLTIYNYLFAQVRLGKGEFRAVYRTTKVADSTQPSKISVDTLFLEFSKTRSVYYNPSYRALDSIALTRTANTLKAAKAGAPARLDFSDNTLSAMRNKNSNVIVHCYPTNQKLTFFTHNLPGKAFMYEEDYPLFQWQMTEETQNIKGYLCKKAVTHFRGRTWEVWYTLDIPTPFGVWKFYGLPGLVVLAKDSKNHFTFELIGLKRLPANYEMITHYEGEPIAFSKITHKKYMQELKKYLEDPIGYMSAAIMNSPVQVDVKDKQGRDKPKPKIIHNPIEYE
ncbi:MAG: GLPGLI family protein [Raineya sp.]|nr:GLPGLI family protein [Raineya sp.]